MAYKLWLLAAAIVCIIPSLAPWFSVKVTSPVVTWLIAIAGGVVMLRAIEWLARPRYADDRLRVVLALTFWPALEIGDVGIRLPPFAHRIGAVSRRFAVGLASFATGVALAALGQKLQVADRGFLYDSSFKTVEIYLLATGANHLMVATFGLAGYRVCDGFRYPLLARSVLDFWRRYNVWIHRWLKRNIFAPAVHRGWSPAAGILAVFAVSGILHEYLIVPGSLKLLGWQLLFFMLHGAARSPVRALGMRITPPRAVVCRARLRSPRPWDLCWRRCRFSSTCSMGSSTCTAMWASGCSGRLTETEAGGCDLQVGGQETAFAGILYPWI